MQACTSCVSCSFKSGWFLWPVWKSGPRSSTVAGTFVLIILFFWSCEAKIIIEIEIWSIVQPHLCSDRWEMQSTGQLSVTCTALRCHSCSSVLARHWSAGVWHVKHVLFLVQIICSCYTAEEERHRHRFWNFFPSMRGTCFTAIPFWDAKFEVSILCVDPVPLHWRHWPYFWHCLWSLKWWF